MRRKVPLPIAIAVIVLVLLIAVIIFWRGLGPRPLPEEAIKPPPGVPGYIPPPSGR